MGLSLREERVEIEVAKSVRMLARRLQLHQVHDVDHPDFQLGQVLAQEIHRGERFKRRHIAAAGHHHIGLAALIVAGPFPDADAGGAMLDGLVHVEP